MPRRPKKPEKVKTLSPIRPNAGIFASYKRKLVSLLDMIHLGLIDNIKSVYLKDGLTGIFPAKIISRRVEDVALTWETTMANTAPKLAEWFAQSVKSYSDPALMTILREGGFSVRFVVTPAMQNTLDSVIGENVSLITKMSTDHLHEIEELVMRSVQKGGDLETLHEDLMTRYGMTRRRAILIARDQNNKATAALTRTRYKEIGITHAKWKHSHGGKTPRPTHVAADGRIYNIDQGCLIPPKPGEEAEYTHAGFEIGCRCLPQAIIPALAAWEKKG